MSPKRIKELRKRWEGLSMVCYCRDGRLCSACRQQDSIRKMVEDAGYNLFTGEKQRRWVL